MRERLAELDQLRGIAVLGILPVNLFLFAWPEGVATFAAGGFLVTTADRVAWGLVHLLFEQKFITLLTLLFGVGIGLFAQRHGSSGGGRRHGRRMTVLALLGLLHAYGLWWGDILLVYAVAGLLAWQLRSHPTRTLLCWGVTLYTIPSALLLGWSAVASDSLLTAFTVPDADAIRTEIELYQAGWWTQMQHRVPTALTLQTDVLLALSLWQALGLMLVGLALQRLGLLDPDSRIRQYDLTIAAFALPFGLTLMALSLWHSIGAEPIQRYQAFQWQYWGSLGLAASYLFGFLHWRRQTRFAEAGSILQRFESVGRLALSSYILQTLICTTLFYGHGLAQFGQWNAVQLVLTAALIILLQLWCWPCWERHFGTGPLERLWRRLTHGAASRNPDHE